MLTAEQYARIEKLMCNDRHLCLGCPLRYERIGCGCEQFTVAYPAEAVKLVHLWWNENRHRFPEFERKTDREEDIT